MMDVQTLLAVLALDALVFAAALFAVRGHRLSDGQTAWGAGLLLQAVGWALFALPAAPSQYGLAIVGTALLSASISAYAAALFSFAQRPAPKWFLILAPVVLTLVTGFWLADFRSRSMIANLLISVQLAVCAWPILLHVRDVPRKVRWVVGGTYLLAATVTLARFLELAVHPHRLPALGSNDPVNTLAFLINHANLVFGNLGLALMYRERIRSQADRLATRDPLTELFNRRSFSSLVNRELLRAQRSGHPLSLLMIDINHFRDINERFGQLAGDRVLRQFARLMCDTLRGQDLGARYGDTMFCVLLPETSLAGAHVLAARVQQMVAESAVGPENVRYRVSIGIAESPPDECAAAVVLALAEDALRRARRDELGTRREATA